MVINNQIRTGAGTVVEWAYSSLYCREISIPLVDWVGQEYVGKSWELKQESEVWRLRTPVDMKIKARVRRRETPDPMDYLRVRLVSLRGDDTQNHGTLYK